MYSAKILSRSRSLLFIFYSRIDCKIYNGTRYSVLSSVFIFPFFFLFFHRCHFANDTCGDSEINGELQFYIINTRNDEISIRLFLCERRTQRAINEQSTEYKFRRLSLGWGIRFNLFSALSIYYQIFLPFSTLRWKKSVTWRGESRSDRRNGSVFIRVTRRILFLFFCWELSVEGINYVRAFPFSE